jgi:ABC-type dipeptide/oligopeptide/nickel transport system permease subunit
MSGAAATETALLQRRAGERRWPPIVPFAVVIALVLCALLAPVLAPHSPVEGSLGDRLASPIGLEGSKPGHLLGTDRHGRDT